MSTSTRIQIYSTKFGDIGLTKPFESGKRKRNLKGRSFGQSFYEEIMFKRQLRKVYTGKA